MERDVFWDCEAKEKIVMKKSRGRWCVGLR